MKIIGHRGAAGLLFENTIASVMKAVELDVDYIEVDVWKTADDEIIAFHDHDLDRLTANATGPVVDMHYHSLQPRLNNGEAVPLLREITAIVKMHNIPLIVELKTETALECALAILEDDLLPGQFIIGSFYHDCIRTLKQYRPDILTAIMMENVLFGIDDYLSAVNPDYVVLSVDTFNDSLISTIKSQNRKLLFYTVNTDVALHRAHKAEPYGIITDFPDRFR